MTIDCALCGGAGFVRHPVPFGHPDFGQAFPCSCQRERLKALAIEASGLPPNTEGMRLETLKPRRELKGLSAAGRAARLLLEQKLCFLTLVGEKGVGKTHIGVGIARGWLDQDRQCLYAQVSRLLERLKHTYDFTPEQAFELHEPTFDRLFSRYCDTPLLILDDLGVEKPTEWAAEKLDTLVDHRYIRHLPTVVTTNILLPQLPGRIADRLDDGRLGQVILLTGPSYRTAGKEAL